MAVSRLVWKGIRKSVVGKCPPKLENILDSMVEN